MRTAGYSRARVRAALVAGSFVLIAACATTGPQQFRTFLLPPARPVKASDTPVIEPPRLAQDLYANEVPALTAALPELPRPSDADLLIKKADDRFASGKRGLQEGRFDDARRDFNQAIETLLTAPENLADRARLERRLEELVEAIYRYDVDQLGAGASDDKVTYDKSPLEGILELTFPLDPSLRNKVAEQVQATVSQLPLEESDAVTGAIHFFSTERGKKIVAAGLRRGGRYRSLIERVLAEEGLPQELIFVAQAESGFLPRAISNKRCVGLWQFAKFRGREYGLLQTPATDDRMDPEKATRAAARHLRDLYNHFGDWYLALAAYNCGPGCVDRAVARTGYADFWTLRRMNVLPKQTSNYVPVILAMTIMSKNVKDYGLDNLETERPLEYDTVDLQTPTHLALVADAVDRPLGEIRELNPGLLKLVAPSGYALHIPKGTLGPVEAAFKIVPPNRRDSWRLHRVEQGETFAALSKRYGSPVSYITTANHAVLPEAGEWVAIPSAYPGERAAARSASGKGAAVRSASGKRRVAGATSRATHHPAAKAKTTRKAVAHKGAAKQPARRAAVTGTPAS